ncbi:putative N-acetylated-alpha-linked acidic dipeptidase isoform X2 [Watersipora subatra]|uniref:putative N-acetylated-alpha-linked acidic dipeptidase isoform X2 n=1 Tax=Watersipora subatra TaxID=2589382 RepID=UPI00355B489A
MPSPKTVLGKCSLRAYAWPSSSVTNMQTKVAIAISVAVAASAGLIIGGLIGHFATKTSTAPTSSVNKPDPSRYQSNRNFLFETISADNIKEVNREYSSKPHLAGSERNNELADMIETKWRDEYKFKTKRDVFNVLLSYPGGPDERNRAFIINATNQVEMASQEVEKELVPNADASDVVPPFNGYAKAADVTRTKAYYVNYCRAEDFDHMVEKGLNLTDAIVICRYGKIFRGNKVKLAQQLGAVAVILYNDPAESVYGVNATYEETFPHSWFLPPSGVERGGTSTAKGDPLTEGYPAKDYAIRKSVEQVRDEKLIPNIPTQPIGYFDAKHFFKALGGDEVANDDWKGRLDGITYRYGGELKDNKKFRILNNNKDERRNITNVFGIIEGSEEPDRYVIMGNHRDAWMNGAVDATSGTAVMMETSRVFSKLMKTGWRPRRTIIFASWDGEEYGIIGSIEWLDEVKVLLAARAVVYLNCDSGVVYNQYLLAGASPLLHKLMYDTAKMIPVPGGQNLYEQWYDATVDKDDPDAKPTIGDLGSGSDHTGFYHRHGITSMDVVYYYDKKKLKIGSYYPLYHTSYDTFQAIELYDPQFLYHKALASFFTEMIRSLSDSVMIPFVVSDYAVRLRQVYDAMNAGVRVELDKKNATLSKSLDHLSQAITKFSSRASEFDEKVSSILSGDPSWAEVRRINDQLMALERAFLYDLGILTRKYIKHVVFAPSATDSYASSAFPGISDALYKIEPNDEAAWDRVKEELTKSVYTIESAAKAITVGMII